MPLAEALTTPASTIEPQDDPKPISGIHAPRIGSQQNAFLWNQQLRRKSLITLAGYSAGHFRLSISDCRLKKRKSKNLGAWLALNDRDD
jgi:hypothetical protein